MKRFAVSLLSLFLLAPGACTKNTPPPTPPPQPEPEPEPVAPIPEGFFALTPQLTVPDVTAAADFYGKAFGAQTVYSMDMPDGSGVMHAEIKIGDSVLMLDKSNEEMKDPIALGGTPVTMMIYVEDVDTQFQAAVDAGAIPAMPLEDQFWGDRYGELIDPFGHQWAMATHITDLDEEQMQQRAEAAMAETPKAAKKRKKKGKPPPWAVIEGTPATEKVPAGYKTVTMALSVSGASDAIEFYKAAFGATERGRMPGPDGKLMHAELQIGDSVLMLADEMPDTGHKSPTSLGGTPVTIHHYVEDVDAVFAKAVEGGATSAMDLAVMFWGDRYGLVVDPAGFRWGVATHVEDVPPDQMDARMKAQMGGGEAPAEGEGPAPAEGEGAEEAAPADAAPAATP